MKKLKKCDWIKYAIKNGERYHTLNGGYSKDIYKAMLFVDVPTTLEGKDRAIAIKMIREEVEMEDV